jgi:FtsH-binding integral membrane protein
MDSKTSPVLLASASFLSGGAVAYAYAQYLVRVKEARNEIGRSTRRPATPSIFESLGAQSDLSVDVLNHLTRVYAALGATVAAATVGAMVNTRSRMSSASASLVGLLFALATVRSAALWKLLGFGFFSGASLSELLRVAAMVNPQIAPMALASSAAIFSSFAVASTLTTRRSLLFLYGGLNSALSVLTVAGLANMYFKTESLFNANLYGGLALFVGYVAADSQLIIERADSGDRNYVNHAMMLYTDAVGIFARIAILLIKTQLREAAEAKKRSRRDGRDDEDGKERRGNGRDYES